MEQIGIAILLLLLLGAFLGGGVWIAIVLLAMGWAAMELFTSTPVGKLMATTVWGSSASWSLTALPLFIWMGEILFRSRISEDMFRGLAPWLTALPGRLMHCNVIGCGIFAAISGSSAATAATIGKMTVPELKRRGYYQNMVIGSLAGAGTLGLLIPPSIIMIVYGVAADVSIARLFIAGVLPGIMLMGLFSGYIAVWALLNPGQNAPSDIRMSLAQKLYQSRLLIPTVLLIAAVIGSIYTGIATPTEAAVLGVAGALILSLVSGTLNWNTFSGSVMGAMRTSCMIAFILTGAAFLTTAMGFTGIPKAMAAWITGQRALAGHADRRADAAVHRPGLFPRRHLHGGAHRRGHPAHGAGGRHRPAVVRHFHRAGGGNGAGHAARGLQSFRAAGAYRQGHLLHRQGGAAVFPAHGGCGCAAMDIPGIVTYLPQRMLGRS